MSDMLLAAFQEAVRGHYAVETELGRGAMGVVFLARDLRLDRPVAIKVLAPELNGADDRARFQREAQLAARLSHPHVVPIHAVEDAGDFTYFAMTYIDGGTLGALLAAHGPLPAEEAGRLLREIAWALAYAHAQGIVHRDIKPDNVLLEQGTRRALVTDFGIARPEDDELGGTRLGTPGFASPEQATGEPADARSDIYALGALGFCLLSGQPPFSGDARAIVTRQLSHPAPRVSEVAPGAPRDLAAVIDRCLAIDPARRYQNAEELAAAIGRALPAPREMSPALRTWVMGRQDALTLVVSVGLLPVGFASLLLFLLLFGANSTETLSELLPVLQTLTTVAVGLATLFGVSRIVELRKLMAAGITLPQVRAALRLRNEQYDEENAVAPMPNWWAKWMLRVFQGHVVVLTFMLALMATAAQMGWGLSYPWYPAAIFKYLFSALFVLTPLTMFFPGRRVNARPRFFASRLRFWLGAAGDRMAAIAGWRLARPALPGATANLPTELALEDAVLAIYDALPAAQRKALGDLKPTVERLARFAERERRAMRSAPGAAKQLAAAIDALDTLRLGLLKLRAGSASLAGVTTDLQSARTLSRQVDQLADAQDEVRRLLSPPTA